MLPEIERRLAKIVKHQKAIKAIQESCDHAGATVSYGGNTGNYDPSNDEYWADHDCPDCGSSWCVYKDG